MSNSEITSPILLDATGQEIVAKLHTQNLLLDILAGAALEHTTNLDEISRIVKAGDANKVFNIGDQIIVPWTDLAAAKTYSMPFNVVHFGTVELQDGETVPGMYLQSHYAIPFAVQFSQRRAAVACPEGLVAGQYYFTFESAYGDYVSAGDSVSFTLTSDVPAGGRLGCSNIVASKEGWRVSSYAADGKTVLETVTPTFTATGTNLGDIKSAARNGNLNCCQEIAYGCNNYKNSAYRQFLNGAGAAGEWWTPQDEFDIAPNELASKAGFLSGFQNDFLSVIAPVKIGQATNTVITDGSTENMYDRFFLPSLQEMHYEPQIANEEGGAWEYWIKASLSANPLVRGTAFPHMRTFAIENHNSPQTVRLRSAYRGGANAVWNVTSNGTANNGPASLAYRCAPACVIC